MKYLATTLLLAACIPQQARTTTATTTTEEPNQAAVSTRAALPKCDAAHQDEVRLVDDERVFVLCDAGQWATLDVRGATGATGKDGAAGATGKAGADGVPGLTALVTTTEEPASSDCPNGGTVTHTGLDTNRDGVLEDGEVQSSNAVCSAVVRGVWEGDYNFNDQNSLADFAQVTEVVRGGLTLSICPKVVLPKLTHVDSMSVNNCDFAKVFPNLTHIGYLAWTDDTTTVVDFLDGLLIDALYIGSAPSMTALTVRSPIVSVLVEGVPVLESISLPNATVMAALSVYHAPNLRLLDIPKLQTVNVYRVAYTGLTQCEIADLFALKATDTADSFSEDNAVCVP